MNIELVWGTAEAHTRLGSFDRALSEANIHNYNLVYYSSVIPEGATVVEAGELEPGRWDVGDPVAVVMAENQGNEPGERIAAGLGWRRAAEGGVFMEHHCGTAEECRHELLRNIEDAEATRDWDWNGEPETKVVETTVDNVGAVIVAAVYRPVELR